MKFLWQQIPSTIVSEIFSSSPNFDGVVLDTEHSPYNEETLFSCIQVVKLSGKTCFVRLPYLDKSRTKICMDAGCDGLIFSTVETVKQSKEIHSFCRYPSQFGSRGQGLVRENGWGVRELGKRNILLIAQIETAVGVYNLHEIEKRCPFDRYMIGPYDLSASLGCVGDFESGKYVRAIDEIKSIVKPHLLGIHIPKEIEKNLKNYDDFGFTALGMDTTFLIDCIGEI